MDQIANFEEHGKQNLHVSAKTREALRKHSQKNKKQPKKLPLAKQNSLDSQMPQRQQLHGILSRTSSNQSASTDISAGSDVADHNHQPSTTTHSVRFDVPTGRTSEAFKQAYLDLQKRKLSTANEQVE